MNERQGKRKGVSEEEKRGKRRKTEWKRAGKEEEQKWKESGRDLFEVGNERKDKG